eukprot:7295677-Prymnesium_polylepis.1
MASGRAEDVSSNARRPLTGREARSEIELERREGGALLAERPLPRGEVLREERGGAVGRPDHLPD